MDTAQPWADLCELASVQHGVFTRPQATALGRSKKIVDQMLRTGILTWHQVQDPKYVADLVRRMLVQRANGDPVGAIGS